MVGVIDEGTNPDESRHKNETAAPLSAVRCMLARRNLTDALQYAASTRALARLAIITSPILHRPHLSAVAIACSAINTTRT